MVSNEDAVLKTLKYSDIFNYPLTQKEIHKFLIEKIKLKNLKILLRISKRLTFSKGLYCVKGREEIFKLRKRREKESLKKIEKAKKISRFLSKIPSVLLIGISGSVSVKNAEKKDDIDLFIITSKNTLWITRFIMISFLKILRVYRKRGEKCFEDKFCLNMFLAEDSLGLNQDKQNLYISREISQMIPLFQRGQVYWKFIKKNKWVEKFLPNSLDYLKREHKFLHNEKRAIIGPKLLSIMENPSCHFQMRLIKKHLTKEIVTKNFIAFHPNDLAPQVVNMYQLK